MDMNADNTALKSRDVRILAVEDSPTQAELLKHALGQYDYRVLIVNNCKKALEAIPSYNPKIVLSDIITPVMTGYELCRQIKSGGDMAGIYVILITSLVNPDDVIKCLESGADSFVAKPYDGEYLSSCIENILLSDELRGNKDGDGRLEFYFNKQKYLINSDRMHILNFLLSTHEIAISKSLKLAKTQGELKRTAELADERRRAIAEINRTLEGKVTEAVARLREKDMLMLQQSRLAAMGEMIGNIAHQWRQPLNALNLLLSNIEDACVHDELSRDFLDQKIFKGKQLINKMSGTIDDFRNFFKPNKEKEDFSLARAIKEVISLVDPSFKNHNVSITVDEEEDVYVRGYPNEFSQVILNILGNAKDAITAGKVNDGRIHITVSRLGGEGAEPLQGAEPPQGVVTVIDNGGGIPAGIIDKIFDIYFTTKSDSKGTGVGLYMSKVIIEDHMAGRIQAMNIEGGAEFKVSMPAAK
ncbi:MAG: hybrid sensor histidine kinase/response regulator [Deltaproteobacteria bacterium]|nr:hybrid sensor histidine kinase/response regulator [Deltaproteobacteria bacterium]